MPDRAALHSFDRLIQAGIAPRRARRILREFAEHHADIVAECLNSGDSASEAEAAADARMGSEQQLIAHGDALNAASPTIQWMTDYAGIYLLWVLPLGAAAVLAFLAARRRETSFWPCVGIAGTCFVGALTNFSLILPPMADSPTMGAGIGIGTDNLGSVLLRAGSTTALVLLPYLRARRLQRHE